MPITAHRPEQRLVDLVGALGGTWHGNLAMCRCPAHADTTPSLSLRQGDKGILVTCFAGCSAPDVLRELDRVVLTRRYRAPEPARGPATRTGNVTRLWNEARPVTGTLAERYLAGRFLLPVAGDLRFHPRCPFGRKPLTVFNPALLVAVREGTTLVGVQRIALDPATAAYTHKATLGQLGSGAWQGGGHGSRIALAEGFESARAYSILHGDMPCWTSLGSRRLDLVDVPDSVTDLTLAGDNDAPGRLAVRKAIRRYVSATRIVRVAYPPPGFKDWAEVLEAREKERAGEG